ncbi:Flp family type IVb pilin [Pseudopontixanthobacter vadosimaris]|uniref:Flp family type IVb pilin n=1 Tax=Pseudopontixanthobacter vadosimaris TaxID=2726450 RepID=UPI0014731E1D|nr:Flp family type IVb pilin [Pseudopontixanthobacter vadosimaris]
MKLSQLLNEVGKDDSGATAVEYGLIVSLIVIACISAMSSLADEKDGLWATVRDETSAVMK